jgi:hypothetical protein
MTRADRILIAALACAALLAWPLVATAGAAGDEAVIEAPAGRTSIALTDDATYEVAGVLGTVVVEVADGSVRVVDSDCPDQVCVRTGAVSAPGSVIACVPNGVVVRVKGGGSDGLDARVR